jgi:hypothetical protein
MFEDLNYVSKETIRKFYKTELNLSYNRCKRYHVPVELNYHALAGLCSFIANKLEEGY